MKKYYTSPKFKKWNYEHQQKELKDSLRYKRWRTSENRRLYAMDSYSRREYVKADRRQSGNRNRFADFLKIEAPSVFSFKKNPEEVIQFINKLESARENKRKVFIVLKNVSEINYDAIVILLPVMISFMVRKIDFVGNFPTNREVRRVLDDSKFIQQLYSARNRGIFAERRSIYAIGEEDGICTHGTSAIDQNLTARVLRNVAKTIWGVERRCPGVQNVLLELMQNTNAHAAEQGESKRYWWLSVSHDHENKKACFAFVDYGIGIFESLKTKPAGNAFFGALERLFSRRPYQTQSEALQMILDGHLHATATGEEHRGKGLPALKDALERGEIKDLCLISNNSYLNVPKNEPQELKSKFSGTFICWEVDEMATNLPIQNL